MRKLNMLILRKQKELEEGFKKWVHVVYVMNKQRKPFQFSRKDHLGSSDVQLVQSPQSAESLH